jgi:phosphoribosyl-dephospho-CoA transferase
VWMTVSAQSLAIYVNFEVHGHSISRGHAKENRACMICGMMQ